MEPDDDAPNQGEPLDPNIREQLRKAKEYAARAAAAERKLAFVEAGVPTADPRAEYFVKGYDGDLNPDAIKAAWDTSFGAPAPSEPAQSLEPDEPVLGGPRDLEAMQRIAASAAGSGSAGTSLLEDAINSASSPEEVVNLLRQLPSERVKGDWNSWIVNGNVETVRSQQRA